MQFLAIVDLLLLISFNLIRLLNSETLFIYFRIFHFHFRLSTIIIYNFHFLVIQFQFPYLFSLLVRLFKPPFTIILI